MSATYAIDFIWVSFISISLFILFLYYIARVYTGIKEAAFIIGDDSGLAVSATY